MEIPLQLPIYLNFTNLIEYLGIFLRKKAGIVSS